VRAKVRDKDSSETVYTKQITVVNVAPEPTIISASGALLRLGETLTIEAAVFDVGVNDAPWRYSIYWGDGTAPTSGTVATAGTPIAATHTFARAGTFLVQVVATDKDNATGRSETYSVTVFAPAPPRIAFVSTRDGNEEIYTVNPDGTGLTRLTNDPADDRSPAWSPDGTRIAWVRVTYGFEVLWVMNADGTGAAPLYGGSVANPSWSRDGRIALRLGMAGGGEEIYTIGATGGGETRLTMNYQLDDEPSWPTAGGRMALTCGTGICLLDASQPLMPLRPISSSSDRSPAWSPEGSRIAFTSTRSGNAEIYAMNVDGTAVTRLTSHAAADGEPAWSPNSGQLAFISDRDGAKDLYVMNADGSGVRRIPVGAVSGPAWRP
jgi:TolB protein